MGLSLFLLFCVYGVVNTYLPVLLSTLGYTPALIGLLQGVFEGAGLLFPVFVSARVDRKGNYGQVMILLSLLMVLILPPLVYFRNFWLTALMLSLFALGYKGLVPVSDALVQRLLGEHKNNYGKIRVLGSIGFVCITLFLQFSGMVNPDSPFSIAVWVALPSLLFTLSVVSVPQLRRIYPTDTGVSASPSSGRRAAMKELPASFWAGIALLFMAFLGMTPSQRFLSLYVREYLGLESYAGLWALSAAAEVPFMFLSGLFIRRWGTQRIILLSLLAITMRNLVYAVFPSFGGAVAGQLFHSVCFGLLHPAAVVFISERASKKVMAIAISLYTSVSVGIASVIGNITGGLIIEFWGYRSLFVIFSLFPILGILLYYTARSPRVRSLLHRYRNLV